MVDWVLHDRHVVCDTFIWYLFAIHQLPTSSVDWQLTSITHFSSQAGDEYSRASVAGISLC
jgi:hypothetical protein